MEDEDCISQLFEYLGKNKTEPKCIKIKSKPVIVEYKLKLIAHNGSVFDS